MWKIEISAEYEHKTNLPVSLIEGIKVEITSHMKAYGYTAIDIKVIEEEEK